MERDFLEKQGLNADQIKAVMAQNGKETNALRDDYDRKLASLNDQIDGYKSQVTDRDKQIKSLSTAAKDNEELRAKFAEVEKANKEKDKENRDFRRKLLLQQDKMFTQFILECDLGVNKDEFYAMVAAISFDE